MGMGGGGGFNPFNGGGQQFTFHFEGGFPGGFGGFNFWLQWKYGFMSPDLFRRDDWNLSNYWLTADKYVEASVKCPDMQGWLYQVCITFRKFWYAEY